MTLFLSEHENTVTTRPLTVHRYLHSGCKNVLGNLLKPLLTLSNGKFYLNRTKNKLKNQ